MMIYTVLGIFPSLPIVEELLLQTQDAGFPLERISVIFHTPQEAPQTTNEHSSFGKLVTLYTVTVPGSGTINIGGPFTASFGLAGATRATSLYAAAGLTAGGIAGALVGLGISKHHAVSIDTYLTEGKIVVGLPATDEQIPFIKQLFAQHQCLQSVVMKTPTHQYPYLLSSLLFEYGKSEEHTNTFYTGVKGGKRSTSQATKKRHKRS